MPEESGDHVVHDRLIQEITDQHAEDDDGDGDEEAGQRYRLHLFFQNVEVEGAGFDWLVFQAEV